MTTNQLWLRQSIKFLVFILLVSLIPISRIKVSIEDRKVIEIGQCWSNGLCNIKTENNWVGQRHYPYIGQLVSVRDKYWWQ